jgi:hypothetical protein
LDEGTKKGFQADAYGTSGTDTKFEMGHGHANAIVAVFRKENGL